MPHLAAVGQSDGLVRAGEERLAGEESARGAVRSERRKEILRQRREELGLSQEDLASRLRISVRAYGNWERGLVKEWTDRKLLALAEALEMSERQCFWLFRVMVDRDPPPTWRAAEENRLPRDPAQRDYLCDYAALMEASPYPTFLVDHRWDVALTNSAFDRLFQSVRPHPTALPDDNFLRFVLFHPDAAAVLEDHEPGWCVPLLAQFAAALAAAPDDEGLRSIRQEVARDPFMEAAYRYGVPHWLSTHGEQAARRDGAVRTVRHPEPGWGPVRCRTVAESGQMLEAMGLTRITFVLSSPQGPPTGPAAGTDFPRQQGARLRAVPSLD
ncbi:helix-turn-helix domain-containing protein [Streptomyces sp. RerS4]|uniref:MmyB family transcriptional regulator n=1 Tax=Streptomyces sp. RerS4 TaxID=2942449 RepID=UPI00201BC84D|nr:helix-turn-helix domain-containing protein [Streptomyces sp. RerS4]UQX03900.1 helix-turn-helix domain-containing protein [Streptomyces sp. RerS4]